MSMARKLMFLMPLLLLPVAAVAQQTSAIPQADLDRAIHDYIVNNPQVILEAVENYKKKTAQEKQAVALGKNRDDLFQGGSPEAGNPDGDVTVVEFFDYNCPPCKASLASVQGLLKNDGKIRFIFKDFPILGSASEMAAQWALAAQKQGKYLDFHRRLMETREPLSQDLVEKTARDAGMDVERARKDAAGTDVTLQVLKNRTLAGRLDIRGTPAFIVAREILPGVPTLEMLRQKVSQQRWYTPPP